MAPPRRSNYAVLPEPALSNERRVHSMGSGFGMVVAGMIGLAMLVSVAFKSYIVDPRAHSMHSAVDNGNSQLYAVGQLRGSKTYIDGAFTDHTFDQAHGSDPFDANAHEEQEVIESEPKQAIDCTSIKEDNSLPKLQLCCRLAHAWCDQLAVEKAKMAAAQL